MLDTFFHLFFPAHCEGCKNPLELRDERAICRRCLDTIPKQVEGCPVCCHPLEKQDCLACRQNTFKFKQHRSLGFNEDLAKTLIYNYKFHRKRGYARAFRKIVLENDRDFWVEHDAVVPVSIAREAYFERDFCQVTEVFRPLAKKLKLQWMPVIEKKLRKDSEAQHLKTLKQRKEDVRSHYVYSRKAKGKLNHKRVLVVDDICTSGSTINTFCDLIKENNTVREINAYTLARTILDEAFEPISETKGSH